MEHHTIETLLGDSNWLREICRQMTTDECLAEDLLQEGWLHALRHGGGGIQAPRSWFRRIVLNIRTGNFRAQGPRLERERSYGGLRLEQNDRALEPGEVLERAELRRLVGEAVLALEEPIRETLMLRFFEDRSVVSIAEHQGVSAETVRKRVNQGLEQVRRQVGSKYPGEKSRFLPALYLAAGRRPESVTGAVAPASQLSGAMAFALLGMIGLLAIAMLWSQLGEAASGPELLANTVLVEEAVAVPHMQTVEVPSARDPLPADPEGATEALSGVLWSAGVGAPVVGVLRTGDGQVVCLTGSDGQFALSRAWVGKELVASAQYHETLPVEVPDLEPAETWTAQLEVAVPSILRLVNEAGQPIQGASGAGWPWGANAKTVVSRNRWPMLGAPLDEGVTGPDGVWSSLLGGPAAARIAVNGGAAIFTSLQPGVMSTIVVPERSLTLRFLDAQTREPVVGLLVTRAGRGRWGAQNALFRKATYLTDRNGNIEMPLGRFGIEFYLGPSNSKGFTLVDPANSKWVDFPKSLRTRVAVKGSDVPEVLEWLVNDDSLRIHLTDVQTGQDLTGSVLYGRSRVARRGSGAVFGARRFAWGG
ncbi:MAG: sigma-70 family RNA polymerase sigma factor, partial [Planctomycetota bacterium]|nr:sigma-70 family RNA polymerase sigma factor [Planctomycetota bacterium]